MKQGKKSIKLGFTLIELLLVVAIISLLSVTVFVSLNPAQRLSDSKNARRTTDVDTILNAIHQSIVDNKGVLPSALSPGMDEKQLGNGTSGCAILTGGCNVTGNTDCADLLNGTYNLSRYLKNIPVDPVGTMNASTSGYSVKVDTNGIVTVRSCAADGSQQISASR